MSIGRPEKRGIFYPPFGLQFAVCLIYQISNDLRSLFPSGLCDPLQLVNSHVTEGKGCDCLSWLELEKLVSSGDSVLDHPFMRSFVGERGDGISSEVCEKKLSGSLAVKEDCPLATALCCAVGIIPLVVLDFLHVCIPPYEGILSQSPHGVYNLIKYHAA